jgi:predicted PurR-regulated permease PerM
MRNLNWRRIAAALVLGLTVLGSLWGLWHVRPVLAPFFIALILAYLISPLVHRLEVRGLPTPWAILTVYLAFLTLIAFAVLKLVPRLIDQSRAFLGALPAYALQVQRFVGQLEGRIHRLGLPTPLRDQIHAAIDNAATGLGDQALGLLGTGTLMQLIEVAGALILAPFIAFYLLRDMGGFKAHFVRALPRRYRQELLALLREVDAVLSGWLRGMLVMLVIIGALSTLACYLLGLPYPLLLGSWAGLTEFVPYIGPVIGAVPALIVGFSISGGKALQVVIAYVVIQQLEGNLISPNIMGHSLGIHPLVIIAAILIGGYVGGVAGMILALPLAGIVKAVWRFLIDQLTKVPPGAVVAAGREGERSPGR